MPETLFTKLNTQRIPEEARKLIRERVEIQFVGERIFVGPFSFPHDIYHFLELLNILEETWRNLQPGEFVAAGLQTFKAYSSLISRAVARINTVPPSERAELVAIIAHALNLLKEIADSLDQG